MLRTGTVVPVQTAAADAGLTPPGSTAMRSATVRASSSRRSQLHAMTPRSVRWRAEAVPALWCPYRPAPARGRGSTGLVCVRGGRGRLGRAFPAAVSA